MGSFWKGLAPVVAAIVIALIPAPGGLAQHTWYYFAIFAGVIVGLMLEAWRGHRPHRRHARDSTLRMGDPARSILRSPASTRRTQA